MKRGLLGRLTAMALAAAFAMVMVGCSEDKSCCSNQAKGCPAGCTKPCCADAKACPEGCTKACCADAKACPADCKKPCCKKT